MKRRTGMNVQTGGPGHPASTKVIDQNVDAIAALMNEEARTLTRHQRTVEKMLRVVTVPAFFYAVSIGMAVWIGANFAVLVKGGEPWDRPPFNWLQMGTGVLGLLMTSVVVITQSRQGRVSERNAHLDLQVSLLIDQKAAKIIELLEEMRRDLPNVHNRVDAQAEQLQVAVDPTLVAAAIAERLTEADLADVPSAEETTAEDLD